MGDVLSRRRAPAPDGAVRRIARRRGRSGGPAGLVIRRVLSGRRRLRRDGCARAAATRAHHQRGPRRVDDVADIAVARIAARHHWRAAARLLERARRAGTLSAAEAAGRRFPRRRFPPARDARACGDGIDRFQARGATVDRLYGHRPRTRRRGVSRADRAGRRRPARHRAIPIRSFSRTRSTSRSRRWATSATGWSNGSGTAFARSSCAVPARRPSGRAARTS